MRHACGPQGRAPSWPFSPRWGLALQEPILTATRICKHPSLERNAPAAAQEAGEALRGAEALAQAASACEVKVLDAGPGVLDAAMSVSVTVSLPTALSEKDCTQH